MNIPMEWISHIMTKAQQHFGASYQPDQHRDLLRRLQWRAQELGIKNTKAWLQKAALKQWDSELAQLLLPVFTVGETYFCRDPKATQWLIDEWLPKRLAVTTSTTRLKIWSAGCCSGEEAYSMLFQLSEALSQQKSSLSLQIWATDLNPAFLAKAKLGIYKAASFRNCTPEFKQRYFDEIDTTSWQVKTEWRNSIQFMPFNFLDSTPPFADSFDLILCRNVLMYFSSTQAEQIVQRFLHRLDADGLLLLGAVEASLATQSCHSGFWAADNYAVPMQTQAAAILATPSIKPATKKITAAKKQSGFPAIRPLAPVVPLQEKLSPKQLLWQQLHEARRQGQPAVAQQLALRYFESGPLSLQEQQQYHLVQAQICADLQLSSEARSWLNQLLDLHPDSAQSYLFSAQLYIQQQLPEQAFTALQKALYLEPDLIIAHLLRAQLLLQTEQRPAALKALRLCSQLLSSYAPDQQVPCSDGLNVHQMNLICDQLAKELSVCLHP
ncbi:CheR family methyltransferase [Rheinheimera soli]|uniref:Chemotaxis protein methyltransferase CheR n=1 Tax=Rheinheimera soli TaxID=443616 RepID=A0ABU1W442_9GAMM|nr:CheR family methyltransferase [Rheinheimera soli]MDR7122698.1 chemotaxis protein methyltransferase CheR [Rheinheimera soli]